MVEHGQTLFVKAAARTDPVPTPLRDAYAACAIYCCRSTRNMQLVRSSVIETYRRLLAAGSAVSIELELARVQAILLLHIALLFDGDVELRREAERGVSQLRVRVLRLQRSSSAAKIFDTHKPASYRQWILMESIRRTILASTFVESIYLGMTEGVCTTVPFLSLLPITVSGDLWAAKSERGWQEALDVVPSQTMPYGEVVDSWAEQAYNGTLEDMQLVLFAACQGNAESHANFRKSSSSAVLWTQ